MAHLDRAFKALRQFNTPEAAALVCRKDRMAPFWDHHFPGDAHIHRLARALSKRFAIDIKEFCEAVEFFARTRRAVRAPVVADLFCGHGFVGLLYGLFERRVERVILVDKMRPPAHDLILDAVAEVGPWVPAKVEFRKQGIRHHVDLPDDAAVVAVHACGPRTDRAIKSAINCGGPVAVMPCCHHTSSYHHRPTAFDELMGPDVAIDIDRTYRLEGAGYAVEWSAIPRAVTPKNRIIIGRPGGPRRDLDYDPRI